MDNKIEINLDNPIFCHYLDVGGLTPARVAQLMGDITENYSRYKNITVWVIPRHGETKMECIYQGRGFEKNKEKISEFINTISDLASESNFEALRQFVRSFQIDNLLD